MGCWRYSAPNEKFQGWFIAFLDNAGCLSVQSDYGDYAYRWNMRGMPTGADGKPVQMREWVAHHLSKDPRYVLDKFASRTVVNCEATAIDVRRHILTERRSGAMTKEDAADEWEHVSSCLEHASSADEWMRGTSIEEPWNFQSMEYPPMARAFMEQAWPRLVALVRADLEGKK